MDSKDKARKLAEIYQAVADGKQMQFRAIDIDTWFNNNNGPNLTSDLSLWRIKPEPREWTVYRGALALYFDDEGCREKIRVREVRE